MKLERASDEKLKHASDEALVEAFTEVLIQRSKVRSIRIANRYADAALRLGRELRRRGPEAQEKLLTLLTHPHPDVRGWSATYSLDFAPEPAEFVLRRLAEEPGNLGFTAQITLELWREGTLKLP